MTLIGVLGGIGPYASNHFCDLLIRMKVSYNDQDNLSFVHYCNPKIPDRTKNILGDGESPLPALIETCLGLEKVGVDIIAIPCNTAHYFLSELRERISTPIVDMIGITVRKIAFSFGKDDKIGILATSGTLASRLYHESILYYGMEPVTLDEEDQERLVMQAIYGPQGIKAGNHEFPKNLLRAALEELEMRGVKAVILGCTEIPLVLSQEDTSMEIYDPMTITAYELIKFADATWDEAEYISQMGVVRE